MVISSAGEDDPELRRSVGPSVRPSVRLLSAPSRSIHPSACSSVLRGGYSDHRDAVVPIFILLVRLCAVRCWLAGKQSLRCRTRSSHCVQWWGTVFFTLGSAFSGGVVGGGGRCGLPSRRWFVRLSDACLDRVRLFRTSLSDDG